MSILLNGELKLDWKPESSSDGEFIRRDSQFRNWITADGSPGPSGAGGFAAAAGRYHLYVSYACPWANRTLIFRTLKKLESFIDVSVVNPYMGPEGWSFKPCPGGTADQVHGYEYMYQVYQQTQPDYSGIVTVPVLYDKQQQTIVNNESSEIIRMLNSAFNDLTNDHTDYYPVDLRSEIDAVNEFVYDAINNGVYRCGFAASQQAYDKAFVELFAALDKLEQRLAQQRYLAGDAVTEADWRLFVTLIRFDPVYVGHFKCNQQRIADYPNLSNYMRELYQMPGIAATIDLDHIKQHYYQSHPTINPSGIVPQGPAVDYHAPHDRDRF
ncbi:MAG: glutathione S-transferase family protein [Gammaproteobacteria bacterium]|nr:glutathione S-transferase family protein [Gammaproteobacteria bacterium]MDH5651735.1 glutathione S-transferase family protein [Gammaproteobacteria bacterium]